MIRAAALCLVLGACGGATMQAPDAGVEAGLDDAAVAPALDGAADAESVVDALSPGAPDAPLDVAGTVDAGVDRSVLPPADAQVDAGRLAAVCPSADAGIPEDTLVLQSQEMLRQLIIGRWVLCDGRGFIVVDPPYNRVISIEADNTFSFWKMENSAFVRAPASVAPAGTWKLRTSNPSDFDVYFTFPNGDGGSIRPYFDKNRRWMYAYSVFSGDSYYVPDPTWP